MDEAMMWLIISMIQRPWQGHMAPLVRGGWDVSATKHKGMAPGEKRQREMDGVLLVMSCMCFVLPESIIVCMRLLICMTLKVWTHLLVFKCTFSLWQHRQVEGNRTTSVNSLQSFLSLTLMFNWAKWETTDNHWLWQRKIPHMHVTYLFY